MHNFPYELAKELKDAGFPQYMEGLPIADIPTLSELIEACGEGVLLMEHKAEWHALIHGDIETGANFAGLRVFLTSSLNGVGPTPEEAVARLWLALNKK